MAQVIAAAALAADVRPVASGLICWWLHCSWCLRNASLVYILDRYIHLLLLYSVFFPTSAERKPAQASSRPSSATPIASAASCVLALQLLAIYADAGYAKWSDPAKAWSIYAPVAALDTYMRHTPIARFARALLGGSGLRLGGSAAVAVEMFAPPVAFIAPSQALRRVCIFAVVGLHAGIAMSMRNTELLSFAAIVAWVPFLDGPTRAHPPPKKKSAADTSQTSSVVRPAILASFVALVVAYQWAGGEGVGCGGRASADSVRRLLLHNRWNVFASAESYVVWEVAPARLSDGSVVDIWRNETEVAWAVPTGPEPQRRRGRWRAFPYTAERDTDAESAFWGTLCDEWEANDVLGRSVVRFHFYLLQADAIAMEEVEAGGSEYGPVSKRLIRQFECKGRQTTRMANE